MMTELRVGISGRLAELLGGIAARRGVEKIDVLRRAIALYRLVDEQVSGVMPEGSRQLAIVDRDEKIIMKIVLP